VEGSASSDFNIANQASRSSSSPARSAACGASAGDAVGRVAAHQTLDWVFDRLAVLIGARPSDLFEVMALGDLFDCRAVAGGF
jgi:hypothetical protein